MFDSTIQPRRAPATASNVPAERARDQGHFNQYGMRDDARALPKGDSENAGDGESARRYGAGGDVASYGNRPGGAEGTAGHVPAAVLDGSGSARAPGLDYGGEAHKGPRLASRQGAELIGELDRDKPRDGS